MALLKILLFFYYISIFKNILPAIDFYFTIHNGLSIFSKISPFSINFHKCVIYFNSIIIYIIYKAIVKNTFVSFNTSIET